jgi:hypothetical protein
MRRFPHALLRNVNADVTIKTQLMPATDLQYGEKDMHCHAVCIGCFRVRHIESIDEKMLA